MTTNKILLRCQNLAHLSTGYLIQKKQIGPNFIKLRIEHYETAQKSLPGQFINIQVADNIIPLLRRPFSINSVNREEGWFEVLFNVIGDGTKILANKEIGAEIDFLGPLGNTFKIPENFEHAVLIAGGLGIAPFEFLSQYLKLKKKHITLFWGNQSQEYFAYFKNFEALVDEYFFATDDGSIGFKGTVAELFLNKIQKSEGESVLIYACGPNPMLKKIQEIVGNKKIACQVSLETKMACGFGVCMGCNIKSAQSNTSYFYVCQDGPVFNIEDIEISG